MEEGYCNRGGGESGGHMPPLQFVAVQLTLSQLEGGHIMPTTFLHPPPDFQTLRRPFGTVVFRFYQVQFKQDF